MAKSVARMTTFPSGIEPESLPIAVTTLLIDGERLTSSFYRQITEADLIGEETGELRGLPIGYFHLHAKSCPEIAHTHVLWGTETELHLAMVIAMQQDERYQQQEQRSLHRQEHLMHALALLLGLATHPCTVEWVGQDERKLIFAGYTLYVDENTATQLKRLQQAREQRMKDEAAWQALAESSDLASVSQEEQRVAAEAILAQLDQQGIELKHPAQDEIEGKELEVHGFYTSDTDLTPLSGPTTWCRYPASSIGDSREEPLLYWRAKDQSQRRQQEERHAQAVETLLSSKHTVYLLCWIFAESMAQKQLDLTRQSVDFLLEHAEIVALLQQRALGAKARKKETPSFSPQELDPDQVWDCYDRELKRYKAFTQRWKDSLEQIRSVRQLYLVS